MRRRNLIRAAMAIACTFAFAVGAHAAAPVARAECDGGSTYASAVGHARGAVVGVIAQTQQDDLGFVYASGVTVERAVGTQVGPVFHGRSDAGLCSEDFATVGARVVVLLDVTIPGVPGGPWNPFYIVGRTVTAAQVASLAGDLPDTGTAQVTKSLAGPAFPCPVAIAAGLVLLVGLLMRYQPRLSTRDGPAPATGPDAIQWEVD